MQQLKGIFHPKRVKESVWTVIKPRQGYRRLFVIVAILNLLLQVQMHFWKELFGMFSTVHQFGT